MNETLEHMASDSQCIELLQDSGDPLNAFLTLLHFEPLSLCVREIMRIKALSQYRSLATPLLDVGCGDGLFWEAVCRTVKQHKTGRLSGLFGIDINDRELELASMRLSLHGGEIACLDITSEQHEKKGEMLNAYRTIIANCSLEHVSQIDKALLNIRSYLHADGIFFLFVPSPSWTNTMSIKRFLARVDGRLAGMYGALFDGFFQHLHLYPHFIWKDILNAAGYSIIKMQGIGTASANTLFNSWLFPSLPAFFYKVIFKRYPVFYTRLKQGYIKTYGKHFLEEVRRGTVIQEDVADPNVVEYFIACRKKL
jgi:2-polyprenyl-3-methyl-5-hydroxy-6-metoxy-1,4-benzoquinol methylase